MYMSPICKEQARQTRGCKIREADAEIRILSIEECRLKNNQTGIRRLKRM